MFFNSLDPSSKIAFATLLVSVVALVVACFTLHSQRATEKNTRPNINLSSQENLIKILMNEIYMSYRYLFALHYQLIKTDYSVIPSYQFWSVFPTPNDYLYESIFYSNKSDSDSTERFMSFKSFSNQCKLYNDSVENLRMLIGSGNKEQIERQICHLYNLNQTLVSSFLVMMSTSFGMKSKDVKEYLTEIYDGTGNNTNELNSIDSDLSKDFHGKMGKHLEVFFNGILNALMSTYGSFSLIQNSFSIINSNAFIVVIRILWNTYYKNKPFCSLFFTPIGTDGIADTSHIWLYYLYDRIENNE